MLKKKEKVGMFSTYYRGFGFSNSCFVSRTVTHYMFRCQLNLFVPPYGNWSLGKQCKH